MNLKPNLNTYQYYLESAEERARNKNEKIRVQNAFAYGCVTGVIVASVIISILFYLRIN